MEILIYGYGNPGRQDDGLGIELVSCLEEWAADRNLVNIQFDSNYQLNIEDADRISEMDLVIFADASEEDIEDFCLTRVDGSGKLSFTTHAASPSYILKLCQELFQVQPKVFLLHIKGYEWAFQEGISQNARRNLVLAAEYLKGVLENQELGLKFLDKLC